MTTDQQTAPITKAGPDRTLEVLRRGYRFTGYLRTVASRVPNATVFRMIGRPTVLVDGPEGVRLFYDTSKMSRRGALPRPLLHVLFGRGAVHSLDDHRHLARKALFRAVIDTDAVQVLGRLVDRGWRATISEWERRGTGQVFTSAVEVFGAAVLQWAGLPRIIARDKTRAHDLAAIVDGFGSSLPAYVRARNARHRCERWARRAIFLTRSGALAPPSGTALDLIAHWRDEDGRHLDDRTAAVELLNVLRPTVAVAWFAAFGALALIEHHDLREMMATEQPDGNGRPGLMTEAFAHEVRRFYPFVPMLPAKARQEFSWNGLSFRAGETVLLDVYGTDHDEKYWPNGNTFDPSRFLADPSLPVSDVFVAQGAGSPVTGHRCPGEGVTMTLLTRTLSVLAKSRWEVPPQDLSYDEGRMPTRPRSGVLLRDVHQPRTAVGRS